MATTLTTTTETTATGDHEISVETAAAVLGDIKPATVRRYLYSSQGRPPKLTALGGGVSADSVEAYRAARDENVTRTRYRTARAYSLEAAMAGQYHRACALAREADRDKRQARKVLDEIPDGEYGAWVVGRVPGTRQVVDMAAVAKLLNELGYHGEIPTKPCADSLVVTPAA